MKSKMDQQILAITNNLKKMNNNSINFRSYYPKIAPRELPILKQINVGFAQGFILDSCGVPKKDSDGIPKGFLSRVHKDSHRDCYRIPKGFL